MSAGKGSTPRKVDFGKYAANYEKIFGKTTEVYICHKCYRIKEWHHIYGMTCEECDFKNVNGREPY